MTGSSAGYRDAGAAAVPGLRSRSFAVAAVGLLAALVAACSTVQVGRNFSVRTFAHQVVPGRTTEEQVRGWLGAPGGTGIVVQSDGQRFTKWTYYYGEGTLPRLRGAHLKILEVQFDQRGIVRAYNWSR